MKEKVKPYLYALLIGTVNGIICGIFLPNYLLIDRDLVGINPNFIYYALLIYISVFIIQYWITNSIITILIRNLKRKINPYLITFIITLISSYSLARILYVDPIILVGVLEYEDYFYPIYILISLCINMLGLRIFYKKIIHITPEKINNQGNFDIYFYSVIIGGISGVLCGIVTPLYIFRSEFFQNPIMKTILDGLMYISSFTVISLLQFSFTSLLSTFLIIRIKPKRLFGSYFIVSIVTITSLFIGRGIFIVPHTLRNGEYLGLIYFVIAMAVYFFGYRWLCRFQDGNHSVFYGAEKI